MKKKRYIILISIAFLYTFFIFFLVQKSPLTYNEIDTDNNKIITFGEAFYGIELGENNITLNGNNCIEYYHLKDGLPVKIVC